jgi:hypothetical protein
MKRLSHATSSKQIHFLINSQNLTPSRQWCLTEPLTPNCPTVNVETRQQFNRLVVKTNNVLRNCFTQWNSGRTNNRVYPVEWSVFVGAAGSRLCESDSANSVSDRCNDKLIFQRPDVVYVPDGRKRDEWHQPHDINIYRPDANATAIELYIRDDSNRRDIPDNIMRYFHPTNLGAEFQAGLNIDAIEFARYDVLGTIPGSCKCPNTICPRSMF